MDRELVNTIQSEFRGWTKRPQPKRDWETIWVLTGYSTTWHAGSDTRRRLESGISLGTSIKKIFGKRPTIYISGYDEHNENLKRWRKQGLFGQGFPEHILIGPQEHIRHTGDQFRLFPHRFLKGSKKIVIVTDPYHIPRVRRYVKRFFPSHQNRFVFYPTLRSATSGDIKRETRKIITYARKGIIPLFADTTKIVVSGTTGLLGARVLRELSTLENAFVVKLDRNAFKKQNVLRAKVEAADFVLHLAGVNRAKNPKEFDFNVHSTQLLLSLMKKVAPHGVFVYTSSFAVYEPPKKGYIVKESSPTNPRNAYGASKLAAEKAIRNLSKKYGLSSVILRISNMYGKQSRPSRAIVDQIRSAAKTGEAITIHTNPLATRDFIYVNDVARVFLKLIKRTYKKGRVEIFNMCTGEEKTIASVVKLAQNVIRRELRMIQSTDFREPESYWRGSFQKARKGLQWQPKVKLREGLQKTLV